MKEARIQRFALVPFIVKVVTYVHRSVRPDGCLTPITISRKKKPPGDFFVFVHGTVLEILREVRVFDMCKGYLYLVNEQKKSSTPAHFTHLQIQLELFSEPLDSFLRNTITLNPNQAAQYVFIIPS